MGARGLKQQRRSGASLEEQANELMPPYVIRDAVVEEADVKLASLAWKHITDDTAPGNYCKLG
jgi:hypothetical protein